jgi:hypothetical protein
VTARDVAGAEERGHEQRRGEQRAELDLGGAQRGGDLGLARRGLASRGGAEVAELLLRLRDVARRRVEHAAGVAVAAEGAPGARRDDTRLEGRLDAAQLLEPRPLRDAEGAEGDRAAAQHVGLVHRDVEPVRVAGGAGVHEAHPGDDLAQHGGHDLLHRVVLLADGGERGAVARVGGAQRGEAHPPGEREEGERRAEAGAQPAADRAQDPDAGAPGGGDHLAASARRGVAVAVAVAVAASPFAARTVATCTVRATTSCRASNATGPATPSIAGCAVPTPATQSRTRARSPPTAIAARPITVAASYAIAARRSGGVPKRRV